MLPVPLNSPPKNAVAGIGGLQPPPACRITHGPNESMFSIAGKSIASIRRSLATVFSIPDDAEAFVGGRWSTASTGSGRATRWSS